MRGHIAKKGRRYYPVVDLGRDESGKRRRKWGDGHDTKRSAERALTNILAKLDQGLYFIPSKVLLGEFLDEWLTAVRPRLRETTFESYSRNLNLHVVPRIGHVRLQALTARRLNTLYGELLDSGRRDGRGGLSPRTVRYIHTMLHTALRDAERWGMASRNVASMANPPTLRRGEGQIHAWDARQLATFLASVKSDRLYAAFVLAATSGMRRGELLGLRWSDVDLDAAVITVKRALVTVRHELLFSPPKTAHGRRPIPLDSVTVGALRGHRRLQAEERLAMGADYQDGDLLFARQDGTPLHPEAFAKVFDRRVSRSALPRIRFHDLRHTYATIALMAGVHPKVVSERLGHSGIAITLDTYSHVLPSLQRGAADVVAEVVFGAS